MIFKCHSIMCTAKQRHAYWIPQLKLAALETLEREKEKKITQEILLLSLPDGQSSHGNKIVELCKLILNRIVCIPSSVSLNVGFETRNTEPRGIRMQQPVIKYANDSLIVIVQIQFHSFFLRYSLEKRRCHLLL